MCSKDCKQFGFAALAATVLNAFLEFLTHEVALKSVYMRPHYATLWNPQDAMKSRMPAMFLAHILYGVLFTKIYTVGYEESKPALGQGLRYGLWMGLLVAGHSALLQYFVYPVSCKLALTWAGAGVVEGLIIGAAVASIYHPHHEAL